MRRALERLAEEGPTVPVAGLGELRLGPTLLSEVTVEVDGRRARALFRAEGAGRIQGIHVGYIGGEAAALELGAEGWRPVGSGLLPRLSGVLSALAARHAQREAARAWPSAWILRVEGGKATVSEIVSTDGGEATERLELAQGPRGWQLGAGSL
ncbi:MAG: hypothetical protein ACYCWW_01940 [Deltaproteobacteria bacterium]